MERKYIYVESLGIAQFQGLHSLTYGDFWQVTKSPRGWVAHLPYVMVGVPEGMGAPDPKPWTGPEAETPEEALDAAIAAWDGSQP